MTIPAAAKGTPIPAVSDQAQFVDVETGRLTPYALQLMQAWREFIVGMSRIVPCSASGTNVITLTPNDSAPLLEKYVDHEVFAFRAANTSTGVVTMLIVARTGNLSTLKAFVDDTGVQATTGDVTANRLYMATYDSQLDSAAGGFVLK